MTAGGRARRIVTEVSRHSDRGVSSQVPAELLNGESQLQSRHVNPNAPRTALSARQGSGGSEGGSTDDDHARASERDSPSDDDGGHDRDGADAGVVRGGDVEEVREPSPARTMVAEVARNHSSRGSCRRGRGVSASLVTAVSQHH